MPMKIHDFQKMKNANEKITFVTCYDYTSAKIVEGSDVNCILVGDSLAMTMYGHETTVQATTQMMLLHIEAVCRAAKNKFIVGDLPFLSYRIDMAETMRVVQKIMQAGAHAIKLEGLYGNIAAIKHIVMSGVPVMGHIGLTPQSVHQLGGYKIQGREKSVADDLIAQAKQLEAAGCFSIVLECVPSTLAKTITEQLDIPTIGIGAGPDTSGQVLVWQDLLGMNNEFRPKFVKNYLNGFDLIKNALNDYHRDVNQVLFPELTEHSFE